MINMATLKIADVYEALSEKIGRREAKVVVDYLEEAEQRNESKINESIQSKIEYLATKEDIEATKKDIAEAKSDILKWMFGAFITLVLMILGLYATLFFRHV